MVRSLRRPDEEGREEAAPRATAFLPSLSPSLSHSRPVPRRLHPGSLHDGQEKAEPRR